MCNSYWLLVPHVIYEDSVGFLISVHWYMIDGGRGRHIGRSPRT